MVMSDPPKRCGTFYVPLLCMNFVMGDVVYESPTHLSDAAVHNYLDVVLSN